MIKIPEASPAAASISGLVSGVLISLAMLSEQVFGEGSLSVLCFLVLGGICLWLAFAFVGGRGKLIKRQGWRPVLQWQLHALLFGACLLVVVFLFDT